MLAAGAVLAATTGMLAARAALAARATLAARAALVAARASSTAVDQLQFFGVQIAHVSLLSKARQTNKNVSELGNPSFPFSRRRGTPCRIAAHQVLAV